MAPGPGRRCVAGSRPSGIATRCARSGSPRGAWGDETVQGANACLNPAAFDHYGVCDLSRTRQDQFVSQWFDTLWVHDPDNAKTKAEELLKARDATPGVARLAINPLLLTLMAFIHGKRSLPRYRAGVELAPSAVNWQYRRGDCGDR